MVRLATICSVFLVLSALSALAQDQRIRVFVDPVLTSDLFYDNLVTAIKDVFSHDPFLWEGKPGDGVLTITRIEKTQFNRGTVTYHVGYFRDGSWLGNSVEVCEMAHVSDCADQLASDTKDASAISR
jgi:hypothetical protein